MERPILIGIDHGYAAIKTHHVSFPAGLVEYEHIFTRRTQMKFRKELYAKVALIKSAYNFADVAYIHLDADDNYYYVSIEPKEDGRIISEKDFINEMLTQSVRHEVYQQTKSIRELLLARAMATSVIADKNMVDDIMQDETFCEDDILKDWFNSNEENKN